MPVFHAVTFNLFNNNNTEYIQNDSVVVEYPLNISKNFGEIKIKAL